jgi:hypothetical protein
MGARIVIEAKQQPIERQQRRRATLKRIDYYPNANALAILETALHAGPHRKLTQLLNAIVAAWGNSGNARASGDSMPTGMSGPVHARAREATSSAVVPAQGETASPKRRGPVGY